MSWIHIIGGLITPNMFVITECFCNEISCVQDSTVWQLKDKSKYPILVAKPGRHTAKIFFFYVKVVSIAKWNSGMKSDTEFENLLWSTYLPDHQNAYRVSQSSLLFVGQPPHKHLSFRILSSASPYQHMFPSPLTPKYTWVIYETFSLWCSEGSDRREYHIQTKMLELYD